MKDRVMIFATFGSVSLLIYLKFIKRLLFKNKSKDKNIIFEDSNKTKEEKTLDKK